MKGFDRHFRLPQPALTVFAELPPPGFGPLSRRRLAMAWPVRPKGVEPDFADRPTGPTRKRARASWAASALRM
jgi:hypothetical protein